MEKIFKLLGQFIVWLLIIMLFAGLILWGIGDVLRSPGEIVAAEVGNEEIYQRDIDRKTAISMRKFDSRNFPENMRDEFEKMVRQNELLQAINRKLLELKAEDLSIELDSKQIIKKEFIEDSGYTKEQLRSFIRSQGGEKYFLDKIVTEKKITFIESIFSSVPLIEDEMLKKLHEYEKQTRDLLVIQLKKDDVSNIDDPKENELLAYYNNAKNNFLAPEFREISYILLDESMILEKPEGDDGIQIEDILYETSGELLDKLAEGMTLEEAADALGTDVKNIASISMNGTAKDGSFVTDLPKIENFIQTVFSTEEGRVSELIESSSGDKYAIIRINAVEPQRIKALDEVRPLVIQAMKGEQKLEILVKKAEDIRKAKEEGSSFNDLKNEYDFEFKKFDSVQRTSNELPSELIDEAFNLKKGDITNISKDGNGNIIMAVIDNIKNPEEIDPFELLETKDIIERDLFQESLFQYLEHLRTKYKVRTDG